MNHTKMKVNNISEIIYSIKNTHVYILDSKTSICFDEYSNIVTVNNTKLTESLSMRLKYILGSLNFLFEGISTQIENVNERVALQKSIKNLFENIKNESKNLKDQYQLERIIEYMYTERIKIKSKIINQP